VILAGSGRTEFTPPTLISTINILHLYSILYSGFDEREGFDE
jgi:hypothetical protein